MSLSISQRISLAFGLLLFLFFITSAVAYLLTTRIEQSVVQVVNVDDPRESAALTADAALASLVIEAAAFGADHREAHRLALAAHREALDATLTQLEGMVAGGADEAAVAELRRLADRAGGLAVTAVAEVAQIDSELQALRQQSAELTDDLAGRLAATDEGVGIDRATVRRMLAEAESATAALLTYLVVRDEQLAAAFSQHRDAFDRAAAALREGETFPPTLAWLDRVMHTAAGMFARGDSLLASQRQAVVSEAGLNATVTQAREVVRERLMPSIRGAKREAQDRLALSTETSLIYLLVMTGFGVFVGAGAAVLLSNGILRPVQVLTDGAEAFGAGQLSHRIDVGSEDEFGRLAMSFNRMAESRQRAEEALRQLAHHDPLTKLPNRVLFQIRLIEALENGRRNGRMVAVHFLDLDHFKDVNDTLGHPAGDLLLQHVADRLTECVRRSDTVARLGGDEFAVIQTNLEHERGISVLAQRIIESLSKPFDLDGEAVYTGTSVGITVYPQDDTEAEMLIKDADMALYRAKQEGRGKYQLYDAGMNASVQARKMLEQELRKAIERDEFYLTYQPQVELAGGTLVGAEALLRWQHPEKGLISPGDFIPVAEQAGLITRLTELVLERACRQAKTWQDEGLGPLRVSVNLSPVDFKRPDLIALVTQVLADSALDAGCLQLEITEGMVMSGIDTAIETLGGLRALGIELSIDDFGTGYSSMNYLKQFPVGGLKIDQSFIRDVMANRQDASITKAIIKVGHSLNLKVIAEGVETREQMDFLRLRACDEVQGYWISRPLLHDQFVQFARDHDPQTFLHGGAAANEAEDAAE